MAKAIKVSYTEPRAIAFQDWSPASLRTAKLQAEGGYLRLAADLVDAALGDDRVGGAISQRVRGLLGLPFGLEAAEDGQPYRDAVAGLEPEWWRLFPEDALAELVTYGVLLGVGLGEIVWESSGGELRPHLKPWDPRWLRYDFSERAWKLQTESGEITVRPGDGKWVFYAPYGLRRPWKFGLWRAVGLWWLLKKYSVADWARYSEVHGSPIRTGVAPDGAGDDDRATLAADLADLGRDTSLVLPPNYDLKLVEATARTWETFKAQIEMANAGIAVAILGQNLTSEVKGGSLAAARVHESVRGDIIRADAETLSTALREQVLVYWAEYNLGRRELAPWPKWQTEAPSDAQIEEWHARYGVVNKGQIRERLGLPPGEDADELPREQTTSASLAMLASGAAGAEAPGFVQGQLYADAVADRAVRRSAEVEWKAFEPVMQELERARSYDEVRAVLMRHFREASPEEIATLAERALLLSGLGGRYAVVRDL